MKYCDGCSAHAINLLATDFELPNVTDHVIILIEYFQNMQILRELYKKNVINFSGWKGIVKMGVLIKAFDQNLILVLEKVLLLSLKPISIDYDKIQ